MKKYFAFILLLTGFSLLSTSTSAQRRGCKVLMPEISKTYKGKCKNGFAHGKKGVAKGVDVYKGAFRKGLPHGNGTYTYSTGEVYTGRWKEGMKHGEGRYSFRIDDKDTTTVGIWENDVYIGPKPDVPYRINYAQSVERRNVTRIGDGNRVLIKFMQNGMENTSIEQFRIFADKGKELRTSNARGYEDVEFPIKCRLTFVTLNKMKSGQVEVIFDFTINEPGDWLVVLHN